jgi:hypothetical protein
MQSIIVLLFFFFIFTGSVSGEPKIEKSGFTSNKVCGECHEDIYSMWKNSLHAQAYEDPIFQAAYMEAYLRGGEDVKVLCLKCHAPTTILTKDYDAKKPLTREGVTCDFCHSIKGIHPDKKKPNQTYDLEPGIRKWGPEADTSHCLPYHRAVYSVLHTRSEFCAGCHEYTNDKGVSILSTYSEWKESPYPGKGIQCQNCHMPIVEGNIVNPKIRKDGNRINLHNLAGGHSILKVKEALQIEIVSVNRREDRLIATVAVTNSGSGHKVPTGFPTRKLILSVTVTLPRGKVLEEERVYQKVLLNEEGDRIIRDSEIITEPVRMAQDNRIEPGERREEVFTFRVPPKKDAFVSARVTYLYKPILLQETEMSIEIDNKELIAPAK